MISPLSQYTHLTHLNLSNNRIAVIENLERLTLLTHLDLSFNQITILPSAIQANKNIHELVLSNNRIASIDDIVNLRNLTNLMILDIKDNPVALVPECIPFIRTVLPQLQFLDEKSVFRSEANWNRSFESQFSSQISQQTTNKVQQLADIDTQNQTYHMLENTSIANRPNYVYSFGIKSYEQQDKNDWIENEGIMQALKKQLPTSQDYLIKGVSIGSSPSSQNVVFLNGSIQTELDSEDNVLDKQYQEQRCFFTGTNQKKTQYSSLNSRNNTSDQSKNNKNQELFPSKNKIEAEERQKSKGESSQCKKSNSGFIDKETSQKFGLLADTAIEQLRYSQLSISSEDALKLKQRLFNQKVNEIPSKLNQGHFTSEAEEDKVDLTNLQSFSEDQRDKGRDSQIVSYFNDFQDDQRDSLGVSGFSREDGRFQRSLKDGREDQQGEDEDNGRKMQEFTLRSQRSPGIALSTGGCQQISNFSQIQSLFDHIESHRGDFCLQEFTSSYTAIPGPAKTNQSLMTTEQAKESRDTFERTNNQCNETFEKQGLSQNNVSEKYVTSENIQNSEQQSMNTSTLNSNIMDQERQCQSVAGTLHMLIDGFLDLHSTFGELSGRVSEAAEKCLTLARKINDCVDETERYSMNEKEHFILEIISFQSDFDSSMAQTSLFISELSSTIKTFMNQVGMNPQNEPSPREFMQPQIPGETMAKAKTLIINLHQSNQNLSSFACKVRDGLCVSKQQTHDFLIMKFTQQMQSLIELFEELSSLSLSCADSFGNIEHTSERLLKYFVHLSRLFQARHVISYSQHRRTTSKDQAKSMILSFREQSNQTSDMNGQSQLLGREHQDGRSFSLESFRLKFQDLEKASIQRCELLQKSKNKIERDFSELSKSHSELQSNYESLQRKHKLLQDKYAQELERKLDQKNEAAFQELEQNLTTTQSRVKELEKELENSESQKQLWMIDTRILKEQVELVNKDFSNLEKAQSFQAEQYSKLIDQHRLVQEENSRLNSHLQQTQTLLREFQAKEQLQVQQHQQLQLQQQQNNQLQELQSQDFDVKQLLALLSSLSSKIRQTAETEEGQLSNQHQQGVVLTEDFLNKLKIFANSLSHKETCNSQTQTGINERQSPQITSETADTKGTSVSKTPSRLRSQRLLLLLEEEQSAKSQSLGESSLQMLSSGNNQHSKIKNDSAIQGGGGILHMHQQQSYPAASTHSPNKLAHQSGSSSSEQLYKLAAKKAAEKKHEGSSGSFSKVLKPKWLSSSPEGKVEPGYNFLPISSDRILKNQISKEKMQLQQQSSFEEGNSSGNLTYHPLTCRQESSGGFIQHTKKKNQKDQRFHEQMTALSCKSALQQSFHNKSSEIKYIEKRSGNQMQKTGTPERIVVHNLQEHHQKQSQEVKPWNFLKKESKHTAGSLKILFQQQQFSKHSCPSNKSLHMNSSMQSVSGIQNQSMLLPQTNNLPSSTLSALNSTGSSNNGIIMNHNCASLSSPSVMQKDNSKKFKNCVKSVANAQKNIQIFRKMQENLKNEEIIGQSIIKPTAVVSTLDGTSFKKIFRSQSNLQQRGTQFPTSTSNSHNQNNNNASSTCNQSTTHQHTNISSTQHNSSNNAQHNSSSNSNISINLFSQLMNINCSQNVSARSKQVNFKSPNTLEPSLSSGFLVPQVKVANPPAKKQKRKNLVAKKTRGCEQSSITEASCPVIPSEQPQKSPLNCTFSGQYSAPNHAKSASSVISSSFQPFNMDASPLLVQDILAQNNSSSVCAKKAMTLKSQLQIDEIPHSSSQYHHFQTLLKSTLKSNKNYPVHSLYPNIAQQHQLQL